MDSYGRSQLGGPQPDPSQEWSGHGPETGLEEAIWQLNLGVEGVYGYPERPDEPNCIYYLRTGFCGYGSRCRFNHPGDRAAVVRAARGSGGEFPERLGQPMCQYYMRTGTCKFGASCKYHHPKKGGSSSSSLQLNYYGYPLRPGEKECTYYLKTGRCKFGGTCKFHHPQPSDTQAALQQPTPVVSPPSVYPSVQSSSAPSSQQYGIVVARPPVYPSYVASPYGPLMISPGVYQSWAAYPTQPAPTISPNSQLSGGSRPMFGVTQLSPSSPAYTSAYFPVPPSIDPSSGAPKENIFPERPGQPDCQYYIKTGDCKYGSSCRFHHPQDWIPPSTEIPLNSMGLPLRPGSATCAFYSQHGHCKFGGTCLYDHPVASSSSHDTRRSDLVSGSTFESTLSQVSSSLSGFFLPKTGHVADISSADIIPTTTAAATVTTTSTSETQSST